MNEIIKDCVETLLGNLDMNVRPRLQYERFGFDTIDEYSASSEVPWTELL